MKRTVRATLLIAIVSLLTGCSFNPFVPYKDTSGGTVMGTAVGAGAGVGVAALAGGSKYWLGAGGIAGGALGYYATSLRFQAGDLIQGGGKVYQIGQTLIIYIPTDSLFEPNTADFVPGANAILDSTAVVLARQPDNNIIISGNTSGFGRHGREQWLSEKRAEKVSAYLWNAGVTSFKNNSNDSRKLIYVGYGEYFPIANHITNKGIRANSRVQIVAYPTDCKLKLDARHMVLTNPTALDSTQAVAEAPRTNCTWDKYGNPVNCFDGEAYPGMG